MFNKLLLIIAVILFAALILSRFIDLPAWVTLAILAGLILFTILARVTEPRHKLHE